ncbi:uncharacterized protein LOC134586259 [Pelobates fuscus]|uniref:uncharacterized protein LOC134586259 n=1 Tax=Pelobates fuscus TaxID=191477 RepID=UPI002FE478E4
MALHEGPRNREVASYPDIPQVVSLGSWAIPLSSGPPGGLQLEREASSWAFRRTSWRCDGLGTGDIAGGTSAVTSLTVMNLLKLFLRAVGIQKKRSSGQLLKAIVFELASCIDQSLFPSDSLGTFKYDLNNWPSSFKDVNDFDWLSSLSNQPCPPKPICLTSQHTIEGPKFSEHQNYTVNGRPTGQCPITKFQENSSATLTIHEFGSVPQLETPQHKPAREDAFRNWSPLTLQIKILQECLPCTDLDHECLNQPPKPVVNNDTLYSSNSTKKSVFSLPLNMAKTMPCSHMKMTDQEKEDTAKPILYSNKPMSWSRSIQKSVSRDSLKNSINCRDCSVQTDNQPSKIPDLYTTQHDSSLYGTFHKPEYVEPKQSIIWDSYDLHLSRSLANSTTSSQVTDWALRQPDERCGVEKLLLNSEDVFKVW